MKKLFITKSVNIIIIGVSLVQFSTPILAQINAQSDFKFNVQTPTIQRPDLSPFFKRWLQTLNQDDVFQMVEFNNWLSTCYEDTSPEEPMKYFTSNEINTKLLLVRGRDEGKAAWLLNDRARAKILEYPKSLESEANQIMSAGGDPAAYQPLYRRAAERWRELALTGAVEAMEEVGVYIVGVGGFDNIRTRIGEGISEQIFPPEERSGNFWLNKAKQEAGSSRHVREWAGFYKWYSNDSLEKAEGLRLLEEMGEQGLSVRAMSAAFTAASDRDDLDAKNHWLNKMKVEIGEQSRFVQDILLWDQPSEEDPESTETSSTPKPTSSTPGIGKTPPPPSSVSKTKKIKAGKNSKPLKGKKQPKKSQLSSNSNAAEVRHYSIRTGNSPN